MGRFHCVLDGCGEVWYKEYSPGYLEYQYPEEEPQAIYGQNLTYTLDSDGFPGGQAPLYFWYYSSIISSGACQGHDTSLLRLPGTLHPPIRNIRFEWRSNHQNLSWNFPPETIPFYYCYWHSRDRDGYLYLYVDDSLGDNRYINRLKHGGKVEKIAQYGGYVPPSDQCTFTVFNDGNQVFTRTENVCPTVNILPCQLDEEWKKKTIEKEAYYQKIQVVDNNSWSELVSELKEFINGDIPNECIEVWLTPTLDLDILPGNTRAEKYHFIGQYCSAIGCPAPEYQVVCNEDCRGCPEGTCEVECDDHLCCYDSEGIAILTIDK